MGRVLYDGKPVAVGDLSDCVHRTWKSRVVQGKHNLRSPGDGRRDVLGIEIELIRTDDVAEDWLGACVDDRVRGGYEVERRNDYLVSRPAADREQR